MLSRDLRECCGKCPARRSLFDGLKSEMAFGDGERRVSGNAAEKRRCRYLANRSLQHAIVIATGNPVQDDSGKAQFPIEAFKSLDYRGNAARAVGRIENQHNRKVQQFRYLGRAAFLASAAHAVIEPHHAFNDGDIGIAGSTLEDSAVRIAVQQPAVEITSGPSAQCAVVAWVEKIWTTLERLDDIAAPAKCGHQRKSDSCFAHATRGTSHDKRDHDSTCKRSLGRLATPILGAIRPFSTKGSPAIIRTTFSETAATR